MDDLTVTGCGADYARLDGGLEGAIVTADIRRLSMSDVTLENGLSVETDECPEDDPCGCECGYRAFHPAAIDGVSEALTLDDCRITGSTAQGDVFPTAIRVDNHHTSPAEVVGGHLLGTGTSVVANLADLLPTARDAVIVELTYKGQRAELSDWYWGDSADEQNGGQDVWGKAADGTTPSWDLEGITSVRCEYEEGCEFE